MDRLRAIPLRPALGLGLLLLVGAVLVRSLQRPAPPAAPAPAASSTTRAEAISALGTLEPAGDVRRLAAPTGDMGGSPRITTLVVQEGDRVRRGQLLASFDSRPRLLSDLSELEARLRSLDAQIRLQRREVERYDRAADTGAAALVVLEEKKDELVQLEGQRQQAEARRRGVLVDLADSQLRAPLDGTVLRIHAREGERPGADGVLELGASDRMEAIAEVYESDIDRVRIGQRVRLISENGGFSGTLTARVVRIVPQVRQRRVLSTDPTGDADARIVVVRLALDAADAARVRERSGLKVIARFEP